LAGTTKDLFSIIITEGYARDANGNIGEYIVSVNRRISEWATSGVINGKTLKRVKNISINGIDPDLNHLEVQDNGYEIRYAFTGDDFDENKPGSIIKKNYIKDDLYIERYLNKDTNEETGEFVIFCSDEQVRFKPGMETPVSTLDLSFDAFSDNALFMNHYTEYIKLPSRSIQY
jgi:hypothetical protein